MFYLNPFNPNFPKTVFFLALTVMISGTTLKSPFGCCDADPDMYRVTPQPTADEVAAAMRRQERAEQEKAEREREVLREKDDRLRVEFWGDCELNVLSDYLSIFRSLPVAYCNCEDKPGCILRASAGRRLRINYYNNAFVEISDDGKFVTSYTPLLDGTQQIATSTLLSYEEACLAALARCKSIYKNGVTSKEDERLKASYEKGHFTYRPGTKLKGTRFLVKEASERIRARERRKGY